jgi:sugar (pentulose or hexulose) kinase
MKSDDGHLELDAMNLFDTLIALVRIASRGYESDIASISFSVTSPTVLFLDDEMNPLLPAILYLDNRSTENCFAVCGKNRRKG